MDLPGGDRRMIVTPQLALRVAILGGLAMAMFAIIFFRLWFLQVLSGDQYLRQARDNRVRELSIQAPRGAVLDRNGEPLVETPQDALAFFRKHDVDLLVLEDRVFAK
jgi:penicillin-binding protein 2